MTPLTVLHRFAPHRAVTACNLCQSHEGTLVSIQDRHGRPLPVTCCASCGLTYVDPIPTRDELGRFYAERYRLEYKQASRPRLKHIYRAGKVALGRLRIAGLLAAPPARVLDCGAGGGEFSYLLTSRGYRLTGIEPNDGYREYARTEYGVDLRPGTLDDSDFGPREFDLITIFHVLEHVPDPRAALQRLAGWLKPGGHLYIEVPNALTDVSSPTNLYHRAHLYYFAAAPLAALAQHAGLSTVLVDGGAQNANLTAIFRRSACSDAQPTGQSAPRSQRESHVTHDAVVAANRQRTLAHYLTAGTTLANVMPRLIVRAAERRVERSGLSGRATLDRLFEAEAPRLATAAG
jgi:2-polyprenyl-3-methyl-5-hydroxy-6-metoxy-1,4-benzoquinol methylase